MRNVGWFVPHERICFLTDRHDVLQIDPMGRLHGAEGPALRYPDGWRHFAWKGVAVPEWLIERRQEILLSHMEREPDGVLRHCMVDIFTPERFVREGCAGLVAEDSCGVLWQRHWRMGGVWAAVEVVNGTPEPDRSYKHYFLPVPGHLRTPRQAVAWTYGLSEEQYTRLRLRT